MQLATIYQMEKQYDKAAEIYEKLLENSDNEQKSYYYERLCFIYAAQGDEKKARKYTELLLKENPGTASIHLRLGRAFEHAKKPELAVEHFLQAIKNEKTTEKKEIYSMQLANYCMRNEMLDRAVGILQSLAENGTSDNIKAAARSKLDAMNKQTAEPGK